MNNKKGSILPIAVMAFAIVAFLVLVNFAVTRPAANHNTSNTSLGTRALNSNGNVNEKIFTNTGELTFEQDQKLNSATAGWKTYTDPSLKFSAKYPPNWQVTHCSESPTIFFSPDSVPCFTEYSGETFAVSLESSSFDLNTILQDNRKSMVSPKESTVMVAGYSAKRIMGTSPKDQNTMFGGNFYSDSLYLKVGNTYRAISHSTLGSPKYTEDFTNFISTVIFTQ